MNAQPAFGIEFAGERRPPRNSVKSQKKSRGRATHGEGVCGTQAVPVWKAGGMANSLDGAPGKKHRDTGMDWGGTSERVFVRILLDVSGPPHYTDT